MLMIRPQPSIFMKRMTAREQRSFGYYGSRRMTAWLATQGHVVNRSQTGPAPDAAHGAGGDLPAPEHEQGSHRAHKVYPYLLGGIAIEQVNQVWCSDVTYIPMAKGFLYLAVSFSGQDRHPFVRSKTTIPSSRPAV
jgi:putative transposase